MLSLGCFVDAVIVEPVLRWLFWDNHKLTGYMATYRFQRVFTPSPNAEGAIAEFW